METSEKLFIQFRLTKPLWPQHGRYASITNVFLGTLNSEFFKCYEPHKLVAFNRMRHCIKILSCSKLLRGEGVVSDIVGEGKGELKERALEIYCHAFK